MLFFIVGLGLALVAGITFYFFRTKKAAPQTEEPPQQDMHMNNESNQRLEEEEEEREPESTFQSHPTVLLSLPVLQFASASQQGLFEGVELSSIFGLSPQTGPSNSNEPEHPQEPTVRLPPPPPPPPKGYYVPLNILMLRQPTLDPKKKDDTIVVDRSEDLVGSLLSEIHDTVDDGY